MTLKLVTNMFAKFFYKSQTGGGSVFGYLLFSLLVHKKNQNTNLSFGMTCEANLLLEITS